MWGVAFTACVAGFSFFFFLHIKGHALHLEAAHKHTTVTYKKVLP
jgi:hypothetical protein